MASLNNVIDVMKLLDKSNCGDCGAPACMAFAVAVLNGSKQLGDCPKLDPEIVAKYEEAVEVKETPDQELQRNLKAMREKFSDLDLALVAERIGAPYNDGRITLHVLGKTVEVDSGGNILTSLHVNPWIAGPLYNYILSGGNAEPKNEWVHFRDLRGGKDWGAFFEKRCEEPCKKIADSDPEFFNTLAGLFAGKKIGGEYESDVSVVLWPLPRVPMMISYWEPEDGMPSELNIFFDSTAEDNLAIEAIYTLGVGLVIMFEKISHSHGIGRGA